MVRIAGGSPEMDSISFNYFRADLYISTLLYEQSQFWVLSWPFGICLAVYLFGGCLTITFECIFEIDPPPK